MQISSVNANHASAQRKRIGRGSEPKVRLDYLISLLFCGLHFGLAVGRTKRRSGEAENASRTPTALPIISNASDNPVILITQFADAAAVPRDVSERERADHLVVAPLPSGAAPAPLALWSANPGVK